MATYTLVHGAWMGKFAWDEVAPRLEAAGHTALTLDLPAHGDDQTPIEAASLGGYRDAVVATIGDRRDIILVGHSMAGMVISAVAEAIPEQLRALVFVSAYLPRDGETLLQLSREDRESKVGAYWRQEDPAHYSPPTIATEGIVEVFGADCPPHYQELLVARHRPEPLSPFVAPVALTEARYGSVPRYYVETLRDNAVSHQLQELMLSRVPVQQRFQLDTSHSPFFAAPDQLAEILVHVRVKG